MYLRLRRVRVGACQNFARFKNSLNRFPENSESYGKKSNDNVVGNKKIYNFRDNTFSRALSLL